MAGASVASIGRSDGDTGTISRGCVGAIQQVRIEEAGRCAAGSAVTGMSSVSGRACSGAWGAYREVGRAGGRAAVEQVAELKRGEF